VTILERGLWCLGALACAAAFAVEPASFRGILRDAAGRPVPHATIALAGKNVRSESRTGANGAFEFAGIAPDRYTLRVRSAAGNCDADVRLDSGTHLNGAVQVSAEGRCTLPQSTQAEGTGGEQLSSKEVAGLPLNKRDFSQLLLLAAGTMTDTNGAANFTQQFAVNGQRGSATVFSMDGIDTTDPEMGGATFSNFNVDAIQEIRSSSGVMPAEIGHGAAGYTQIVTKSGSDQIHGSVFEFVRNAAFDARNFFDRRSVANPGRIPPFIRNEFGFTNGGPVFIPGLYDGRKRTWYFGQYQGFRQVLGTTQVVPVPTLEERQGRNTTAFPGDTLFVPVNAEIARVLQRYPLPNDPQGSYGARTYATSSKVTTVTDQFSVRIDHKISSKAQLFSRFNLNNVSGPLTNPSQTAIDPSFAIRFLDHQRNFGLTYTRTISARLISDSSFGFIRSTPVFPTSNTVQPALKFADGLYEAFNNPAGAVTGSFGNLIQFRQNVSYSRGTHNLKMGFEYRGNLDTTIYATGPNGQYTFGGGKAYSPVEIRSASGGHDIHMGDALPDALSGFLTATPFSYGISLAPPLFAQGENIGDSAVHREAYNLYFQDDWKVSSRVSLNYGLRYEVNTRIREAKNRSSSPTFLGPDGHPDRAGAPGVRQALLVNPQPIYDMDWSGWGPRAALDWRISDRTIFRAGASLTTLLPNLFQDNFLTAGTPFVVELYRTSGPGAPVPFEGGVSRFTLPEPYAVDGSRIFATGRSTDVPANTEMDLLRFERELAALNPSGEVSPITMYGMSHDFRNGYVGSYTAGLERDIAGVKLSASYVATAGIKLVAMAFPNGYGGADPKYAPFTAFDKTGRVIGGFGPEYLVANGAHSTYHSLQTSVQKSSARAGLGFQASYTFSKALDNTSAVLGGFFSSSSGTLLQTFPQDPRNTRAEKGPSTFDIAHVLTWSLIQELPLDRVGFLRPLGRRLTSGWQVLNVTTFMSGPPFTIYSGIQQTGAGSTGADRPDQVGTPVLSTSRTVREDYFGLGADNASLFSIPIQVPGGSGPHQGRFGAVGRNTFRGPAFHNVDVSVMKETPVASRGGEPVTLQFRAEIFNIFNIVNFGLPSNIVLGPGFGVINRTAGTSRQIQFSLKLLY
jgi:hypothetical protein